MFRLGALRDYAHIGVVSFIRLCKYLETFLLAFFFERVRIYLKLCFVHADIRTYAKEPWDIKLHKQYRREFYLRVANNAPLGLGETYVDGMWDCDDLTQLIHKFMYSGAYKFYLHPWQRFLNWLELYFFNNQTPIKAWEVGKKHYDTGNDLFEKMLDPNMQYSCGYWRTATTLNQAQIDKMDLIAKKMMLKPGMKVLDIGCGWGGLAKHLAKHYGVNVVGITISKEGAKYGQEVCKGLPVEIRLMDYRDLNEKFDRIVSVGMFEHVGHNNYADFFNISHRCLEDDGIFLLHTIGINHADMPCIEPWMNAYIFPNGILPYYKQITQFSENLFIIEDWQNFGHDYSKTLAAWRANFKAAWPKLRQKYGERFYRMWIYYLCFSEAQFTSRKLQVWQVVLTKNGMKGGYYAAR